MANTINQRMTVNMEGNFVVFLIGMRINRFWKFHKWLPVASSMPKMLKELSNKPESGFLGFQTLGGIPPVIVQYWRSFEQLEAYAKDREGFHYPAWKDLIVRLKAMGMSGYGMKPIKSMPEIMNAFIITCLNMVLEKLAK